MQGLQKWLVLAGIALNVAAFVYSVYTRMVLYSIVFFVVSLYLVVVYVTNDDRPP